MNSYRDDKATIVQAMTIAHQHGWQAESPLGAVLADVDYWTHYPHGLLFDHVFALALWGDNPFALTGERLLGIPVTAGIPLWQYHLQQMVIADDHIDYLRANLPAA